MRSDEDSATYYLTIARDTDRLGYTRCIRCNALADDVHEIIPRSAHGPLTQKRLFAIENRCCLCRKCHKEVHNKKGRGELLHILQTRHAYKYTGESLCLLQEYRDSLVE